MKKLSILILLTLGIFANVSANQNHTDTIRLSLKEAVKYGISNNKQIYVSKKNIEIYKKRISETIARGLPQIDVNADYSTNFNHEISFGPSSFKLNDQAKVSGSIRQLIFSGEWIIGLQMSKLFSKMADDEHIQNEIEVKKNIYNSYYLILASEKSLEIMRGNLKNMEDILSQNENMYKSGAIEEVDVDQLRISTNQIKNSISSMERGVKLNYSLMKILLGLNTKQDVVLTTSLEDIFETNNFSKNILKHFDVEENINYAIAKQKEKIQEKNVSVKKWGYAPTLSGVYSYTHKILKPEFDMSPKQAAMITLNIPIFNGLAKRTAVAKEKLILEQAKANTELTRDRLITEAEQLKFNLKNAIDNYRLQKENVKVAKKVIEHIRNKYKTGYVSSLDMVQANNNYLQAESNFISSSLSLIKADLDLRKLLNDFIY